MMTLAELVMMITIVLMVAIGFGLVRSSRSSSPAPRQPADRVCPNSQCRHRNPSHAVYCARCGRRLGTD
ncbi:MAG: hypothetical protein HY718_06110 [Planctomycetes bacterium]|nr:hypothetical protein [Planctomycetota bacterium]